MEARTHVFTQTKCFIALSVSAASDPDAQKALEQLPNLKGCQAHTSVMVGDVDRKQFMKLFGFKQLLKQNMKIILYFSEKGCIIFKYFFWSILIYLNVKEEIMAVKYVFVTGGVVSGLRKRDYSRITRQVF